MQEPNITWESMQDNFDVDPNDMSGNQLIIINYGGDYNYTQYYLNITKDEAIKRFTEFMVERDSFEIGLEGWNANAQLITFSNNGEAWVGKLFNQMDEMKKMFKQ